MDETGHDSGENVSCRFGLLGALEVRAGGELVPIDVAEHRVLLASLLVDANRVVSSRTLSARLWGENPPSGARNTLQDHVLRLQRTLGETASIRARPDGYVIEVDDDAVDLFRFDLLTAQARTSVAAGDVKQAATLLREALRLWRGDPLSDVPSAALHSDVVPELIERRLATTELRLDIELKLGRHQDVLPELHELTTRYPLRERFWAQRILALCQAGRQSEALECYHTVRTRLADELCVDPSPELREIHAQVLSAEPVSAPKARSRNVPAERSSFVGRSAQLRQAEQLLADHQVVTVTGIGGVGKTRLARRVAAGQVVRDGVWLADLVSLADPRLVDRAIADALGIEDHSAKPRLEVLIDRLWGKELLLVVDNCEHVAGHVAELLTTLVSALPGLRVLATSRRRLGVPDEILLPLPPLTEQEAAQLLAERAPDFRITPENQQHTHRLCQRLAGIPLAIELVAVQLTALSIEDLLERVEDWLDPDRQETMPGVLDWSYAMCSPAERLLWARISVFAGGFELAAAQSVCAGVDIHSDDVLDVLAGLAGKSIVTPVTDLDRTRYSLVETLREYGTQQLDELDETEALKDAHRRYYQDLVRHGVTHDWCSPRELEWQHQLHAEMPNVRAALDAGLGTQAAVEMAAHLSRCCFFSGHINEGRYWLAKTLDHSTPDSLQRTNAIAMQTWIAVMQGDVPAAAKLVELCRTQPPTPATLFAEGTYMMLVKSDPSAIALLDRARQATIDISDGYLATLFWTIGAILLTDGPSAEEARSICLAEAEKRDAPWSYSWAVWCAGLSELRHGDPDKAVNLLRDALRRQYEFGDHWGPLWAVEALAWANAANGDLRHSARLLGAAWQMRHRVGVVPVGLFGGEHLQTADLVRAALGIETYNAEFTAGTEAPNPIALALR